MSLPLSISTGLQYQHLSLNNLIEGLTNEQIRRQIIVGKWSVFENIVHLQTYQHTFIQRLKRILLEDNPIFPRYTPEADPLFHDNCSNSTQAALQDMLLYRNEILTIVASLKESDLNKTGSNPTFGKMNLLQWLNFFLLHEAHHHFTIFKLVAELKKAAGDAQ
jgi:uncharacterized damage-inducible protein DinB